MPQEDVRDVQREVEILNLVSDHPNVAELVNTFEDTHFVHLVSHTSVLLVRCNTLRYHISRKIKTIFPCEVAMRYSGMFLCRSLSYATVGSYLIG